MNKSAIIDGIYRYELRRVWDESLPLVVWIMLNPSTADAEQDDPTIRKCIGFSKRWGYGGIVVVNIFAVRATDWKLIRQATDPIGPRNDEFVQECLRNSKDIVAAWGIHGDIMGRGKTMEGLLKAKGFTYKTFGRCKNGEPKHPLMLGYNTERCA